MFNLAFLMVGATIINLFLKQLFCSLILHCMGLIMPRIKTWLNTVDFHSLCLYL